VYRGNGGKKKKKKKKKKGLRGKEKKPNTKTKKKVLFEFDSEPWNSIGFSRASGPSADSNAGACIVDQNLSELRVTGG
jgi:hypothetical protein